MNRQELRQLVIEATGRSDKTDLINSALNIALEEISSRRLWSELLTEAQVTLNEAEYQVELGTASHRVTEVRIANDDRTTNLAIVPKTKFLKLIPRIDRVGWPRCGYLEKRKLVVAPIADQDYEVVYSYYGYHPQLTDDADELVITGITRVVVAYTIYWVMQTIEKHEDANQWFTTYNLLLGSAMDADKHNVVNHQAAFRGSPIVEILTKPSDPFRMW